MPARARFTYIFTRKWHKWHIPKSKTDITSPKTDTLWTLWQNPSEKLPLWQKRTFGTQFVTHNNVCLNQ